MVPSLLNSTPFAPNGGVRNGVGGPIPGPSSGSLTQGVLGVPPPEGIFQIAPLKESDTYPFPELSKVSALRPEPAIGPANTLELPVTGSTLRTFPAPKSSTHKAPVAGLKRSPRIWGLEFAMVTCLTILPLGEITKRLAGPVVKPGGVALKPNVGT